MRQTFGGTWIQILVLLPSCGSVLVWLPRSNLGNFVHPMLPVSLMEGTLKVVHPFHLVSLLGDSQGNGQSPVVTSLSRAAVIFYMA